MSSRGTLRWLWGWTYDQDDFLTRLRESGQWPGKDDINMLALFHNQIRKLVEAPVAKYGTQFAYAWDEGLHSVIIYLGAVTTAGTPPPDYNSYPEYAPSFKGIEALRKVMDEPYEPAWYLEANVKLDDPLLLQLDRTLLAKCSPFVVSPFLPEDEDKSLTSLDRGEDSGAITPTQLRQVCDATESLSIQ